MASVLETAEPDNTGDAPNHRWLALEALEPGMVVARPVVCSQSGVLAFRLGEGVELTATTISQLYVRGVECVAVLDNRPPHPEAALRHQAYVERLLSIFGCSEESGVPADCRPFFQALLEVGPER